MSYIQLSKKVFCSLVEQVSPRGPTETVDNTEGTISSINEFIALIADIIRSSKDIYNIKDVNELIPLESYPRDLLYKANNGIEEITQDSKKQLTIVTYTANELPAQVSAHSPFKNDGIRAIKRRLLGTIEDPNYSGYSIARIGRNIEANVNFLVWGLDDKSIRDRSVLLRKIIQSNVWFLKHKGLTEIVWLGATENDIWDKQNVVQNKKESYRIVFTEYEEVRQKNIEQFLISIGIDSEQQ